MTRRRLLGTGAAVAGVGALGVGAGRLLLGESQPGHLLKSRVRLPERYRTQLPVPPVLKPVRTTGTTDFYEITQRTADLDIVPGHRTRAWTYQGSFPGPTLVSRSGRRTVVRHRNELPHPTVTHLHGGHTPAASDGYPTDLVLPADGSVTEQQALKAMEMPGHDMSGHGGHGMGADMVRGERTHTYPMNQRAATLWYHDHRMGYTGLMVWQGMAGFHLVRDEEEEALPLPRDERDVPLMITDRAFDADGSFRYPAPAPRGEKPGVTESYMNGVLGDVILVNGAPWPVMDTERALYRLRLLNGSNARTYRLALDPQPEGGSGLVQIGSDGGLLAEPERHDELDVAPGERFDVLVDFSRYRPGTRVRLVNRLGSGGTGEVMRFDVSSSRATPSRDAKIPERLAKVEELDRSKAVRTRDFRFRTEGEDMWAINGKVYRPGASIASPKLGDLEIWRLHSDLHHPVHLHLDHFQVLARMTRDPGAFDKGWKDTVNLHAAESVEIAVRFTDYAGKFMLHCHNLEHEDMGMMADFTTVE